MPLSSFIDERRPSSDDDCEAQTPTTALLQNEKSEYANACEQEDKRLRYGEDEPPAHTTSTWTTRWPVSKPKMMGFVAAAGVFLLPSPITNRFFPDRAAPPDKIHKTAWLDGLRGVAALSVAIFHFTNAIYNNTVTAWGANGEYSIMKLPFIRLIYAGPFAVSLFFVISGFALSIKPVEYMQDRTHDGRKLFKTLNSAAFRRPFRLYIPAFASAFVVLLVLLSGIMEFAGFREIAKDVKSQNPAPGTVPTTHAMLMARDAPPPLEEAKASPVHEISALENVERLFAVWFLGCLHMLFVFDNKSPAEKHGHPFNSPLWSIVVEFKASILLFLVHLALSGLRQTARLGSTLVLLVFAIYAGTWDMVLFIGGFGIAQLEHIMPSFERRIATDPRRHRMWNFALTACLISGLYLASYPDYYASIAPGYSMLSWFVPSSYGNEGARFWQGIGAIQIVFALSRMPALSAIFATRPIRYIGKISFSLYLVHSMVLVTWGVSALYLVWKVTGRENVVMNAIGFVISVCLLLPVIVWVADVFTRAFDTPSVKFARWLESKCIRDD